MTFDQIKTFLWVARLGGFRKAAERLNLSQPAISTRIANLEQELRVPLFERGQGELVLTNIVQEAIPLIRYRTRDITRLHYDKCDCGRTMVRMEKTMGRSDDMLIIKGVNVFPTQIEEVLFQVEGCEPHYQLIVEREGTLDTLEVQVEVNENIFFDEMRKQRAFVEMLEKRLATNIGLHAKIKLVEPSAIPRHEGKANRIIDKRNK